MVASVSAKDLQSLSNGNFVSPQAVAKCKMVNGEVVRTGEWVSIGDLNRGCCDSNIAFDSFEAEPSCPTAGPINGECTGGVASSRWYFGETYCNGAATNDMTVVAGKEGSTSERLQFGWFWYVSGPGSSEECNIAVFTGEAFEQDCTGFGSGYSGVLYSFGVLGSGSGLGYYYTEVDLCGSGLFHQMPAAADGWYQTVYLTTGNAPATCAQPMLWGQADPASQGTSGELQYDDDNPRDLAYQVPTECYSYAFGVCPDPAGSIGAMTAFYTGEGGGDACEDNGCVGANACNFRKLVCKNTGKLIAKGTGTAGDQVCVTDASGNFVGCANVNNRGKWKNKENDQSGSQTRSACGDTRTANCP
jgi:hypothetical protein